MTIIKKYSQEEFDGLAEEVQKMYVKKTDGVYYLDIDDSEIKETRNKLDVFRKNNLDLMKAKAETEDKLDEMSKKLDSLEKKRQSVDDKKMMDNGQVDELVKIKTKRMKADFDNQIKALKTDINKSKDLVIRQSTELERIKIDNKIQVDVSKVGTVRQGYMEDIIALGKRIFSIDQDGKIVALDDNGGIKVGKDPDIPLTIKEWAESLPVEKSAYFEGSTGTESKGSSGGSKSKTGIKWSDIKNPQERIKLLRKQQAK